MTYDRKKAEKSARKGENTKRSASKSREPKRPLRSLQRTLGNQAIQELVKDSELQAKLSVNSPGDRYEREADRAAKEVVRMPEPVESAFGNEEQSPIERVPRIEKDLRRERTLTNRHDVGTELERNVFSSSDGGRRLPASVRSYFEPRFGADFGDVRVHDNARATELNRQLNAEAFTYGADIYFKEGNYKPDTASGRALLAHELTHVLQQTVNGHRRESVTTALSTPIVQRQRSEMGPPEPTSAMIGPPEPGRERDLEGTYRIEIGGEVRYLTPMEYYRLRRKTINDLQFKIDIIRGRAEIGKETINEFMAETHNWVGVISDIIADVVPPHPNIYQPAIIWCDAAEGALERENFGKAVENIERAQERYNEAYREWYNYREATIGGAQTAVSTLEVTRDVSFAVAGGLAGAAFAPAGASLIVQGGVSAATGAGAKAVEESATRGSEMYHGLRQEWDVAEFLQSIGTAGVTSFAGTLVSGPLAKKFSTAVLGRLSDDAAGEIARELSEAYGEEVTEQTVRRMFETSGRELVNDFLQQAVGDASSTIVSESIKAALEGLEKGQTITPAEFIEKVAIEFVKKDGAEHFVRFAEGYARQ